MKGMFVFGLAIGLFFGAAFGVVIYVMMNASKERKTWPCSQDLDEPEDN